MPTQISSVTWCVSGYKAGDESSDFGSPLPAEIDLASLCCRISPKGGRGFGAVRRIGELHLYIGTYGNLFYDSLPVMMIQRQQ